MLGKCYKEQHLVVVVVEREREIEREREREKNKYFECKLEICYSLQLD